MKVLIPGPLRSYTSGAPVVDVRGASVEETLRLLEEKYQGIRFRIIDEQGALRRHIKIFINTTAVRELATPVRPDDELMIVCALSGG